MNTAMLGGEFDKELEIIPQGTSGWNQYDRRMIENSLHHDLPHIQKSAISTFLISQNREAEVQGMAIASP